MFDLAYSTITIGLPFTPHRLPRRDCKTYGLERSPLVTRKRGRDAAAAERRALAPENLPLLSPGSGENPSPLALSPLAAAGSPPRIRIPSFVERRENVVANRSPRKKSRISLHPRYT